MTQEKTLALIVAGGSGSRAPGEVPKQYRDLAGLPVLRRTLALFTRLASIDAVRVVIREEDRELYEACAKDFDLLPPVKGGATRQDSVRLGLEAMAEDPPARVLIHDAARPFVSARLISGVIATLDTAEAVLPAIPVVDTLRRKSSAGFEIVARDGLMRAQTPQGFHFGKILDAHRRFTATPATDDIQLAQMAGMNIADVPGDDMNIKLTTAEDFLLAERIARGGAGDVRTGSGYDVHRFSAGDHVWLCGVKIPHEAGLEGHSDADAGLHALTDAILGALGDGDIGVHFPPSDPQWRGGSSDIFLKHAGGLVAARGGRISHVDVTLICERPKIGPHREAMRVRIADILSIAMDRVSIKATTTEGLGFTGRREGIAAEAVATIVLP
jgi:2-C-methyl-D-erythritol 4-phosphate cytidylyltransferase/2-C-methyl-D-erythritol 2,4-cyclodiphosphate synthase